MKSPTHKLPWNLDFNLKNKKTKKHFIFPIAPESIFSSEQDGNSWWEGAGAYLRKHATKFLTGQILQLFIKSANSWVFGGKFSCFAFLPPHGFFLLGCGEVVSAPCLMAATEAGMLTALSPHSWCVIYGETNGFPGRRGLAYWFKT